MKKVFKNTMCLAALTSVFWGASSSAYSESTLPDLSKYKTNIVVDGISVSNEQMPIYNNNQILIPVRVVLENSDFQVKWNNNNRTAEFISPEGDVYVVNVDKKEILNNTEVLFKDMNMMIKDGYTYASPEMFNHIKEIDFHWDKATNMAIITTQSPKDNLYIYDLGQNKLQNASRPDTNYQMQVVIGVPDGDKRPIVVILHGSHPIDKAKDNRYDIGFSYLVNDLADAGYLALSMNVAINYSFEDGEPLGCERSVQVVKQQMDLLSRAINGEKGNFPCDLKNKGDLDKIVFIGHSRAGTDIFEIGKSLSEIGIDGFISVAPALISPLSENLPDVPTGIIIPQFDGDVVSLDGAKIFDELENDNSRNSPAELVYLKGGNHGGFSTALVRPDPFADKETLKKIISPEKQRKFLTNYAISFINSALESGETIFSTKQDLPDTFSGCDVLLQVDSKAETLFSAKEKKNNFYIEKAKAEFVNASSTLENTAGAFNLAGGFTQYDLMKIVWQSENSSISFEQNANLKGRSYLQIDIAQDSSDELNKQQNQDMIVKLEDKNGKSSSIKLPSNTTALQWQEGQIKHIPLGQDKEFLQYSTPVTMGTIRINIDDFKGVDLPIINKITLSFPKSSGSVMLREIQVV